MNRRNTVSVTPAIGASTVAGAIVTPPMDKFTGTGTSGADRRATVSAAPELSQDLRTVLFYLARPNKSPRRKARAVFRYIRDNPRESVAKGYFFAVSAVAGAFFAYLRRKRSTRPAVSISFCLPVKNGWQAEQISTLISPLWVDRVTKALPHAQCTRTSL